MIADLSLPDNNRKVLKALKALPPDHDRSSRLKHVLDHLSFVLRWKGVEHKPSLHVGYFSEPSYSVQYN
jgi:hypothetical protein